MRCKLCDVFLRQSTRWLEQVTVVVKQDQFSDWILHALPHPEWSKTAKTSIIVANE